MPTPTQEFAEIAAKYGNVDPRDAEAVQRWFSETLPSMTPAQIEIVLDELLSREGSGPTRPDICKYPAGVPLPRLSTAPFAPIPLLARGWKIFFKRLLQYTAKSRRKGD